MRQPISMAARINVAFDLVCRDKDGNVLNTIKVQGAVTPEALGLTQEQAQELTKEPTDDHDRQ